MVESSSGTSDGTKQDVRTDERPSPTLAGVSDSALWDLMRTRGRDSHASQCAFAGLIPEAARRKLQERPGYGSLTVLARRMGGLCEHGVQEVLRLDRQLADRPQLRALLETGRAGWSKLRAVAAIATAADDAEWARHVVTLPKDALEALVRARRQGLGVEARGGASGSGAATDAGKPAGAGVAAGSEKPNEAGAAAGSPASSAASDEHPTADRGADGPRPDCDDGQAGAEAAGSSTAADGLLSDDRLVSIRIQARTAELLQRMSHHLRKNLRSTMSISDVIETLVHGFSEAKVRPFQYCEVIVRREADGAAHCRTRYGDVRVTDEQLTRGQAVRPPVDLEQMRQDCKARVKGSEAARAQASCENAVGDQAPGSGEAQPRSQGPREPASPGPASHRHIPAHVQRYLELRYSGLCGFPGCHHPATILHHLRRFALDPSHDPDGIVPLCKAHEGLAHAGLIENEEGPPNLWRVRHERTVTCAAEAAVARVDAEVLAHRRPRGSGTSAAASGAAHSADLDAADDEGARRASQTWRRSERS